MGDVSRVASRLMVMNNGTIELTGPPKEIFRHEKRLAEIGLGVPKIVTLLNILRDKGYEIDKDIISMDEAKDEILKLIRRKSHA